AVRRVLVDQAPEGIVQVDRREAELVLLERHVVVALVLPVAGVTARVRLLRQVAAPVVGARHRMAERIGLRDEQADAVVDEAGGRGVAGVEAGGHLPRAGRGAAGDGAASPSTGAAAPN